MRRRWTLVLWLAAMAGGSSSCGGQPALPDHYWNGPTRITIQVDVHRIALRVPRSSPAPVDSFVAESPFLQLVPHPEEYPQQRVKIFPLSPQGDSLGVEAVHDTLVTNPAFDLVGLVVVVPSGKTMVLTNKIIVRFKPGVLDARQQRIMQTLNLVEIDSVRVRPLRAVLRHRSGSPLDALRASNELVESYSHDIESAEPSFVMKTVSRQPDPECPLYDPCLTLQWHLRITQTLNAWCKTKGDSSTIIAIFDEAVDPSHPDLNEAIAQVDILENDATTSVDAATDAHGTKAAGVAVGRGNNGRGIAGSCPECGFLPIRGTGGDRDQHGKAFYKAKDLGARVMSNSWGYDFGLEIPNDVVKAIGDVTSEGPGMLVVFATPSGDIATDVSALPNVIAVGQSTSADTRHPDSGYGEELDLLAPAERIVTTAPQAPDCTPGANTSTIPGGYDLAWGGSSAAAPLVAGIAGLVLSANGTLTATEVANILRTTAYKIKCGTEEYAADGFNTMCGYGRVDAFAAVKAALAAGETELSGSPTKPVDTPGPTDNSFPKWLIVLGLIALLVLAIWLGAKRNRAT